MNMRARWIVIAVVFGYLAAVATGGPTPNYIGSGICFALAVIFLAVGIWDSRREDRYVLKDPE